MAQATVISRTGSTFAGIESTFETASGSMIRGFVSGTVDVSALARSQLKVEDERVRGFAHVLPVHGMKSENSGIKFELLFKPNATQLSGATPTVPASLTFLHTLLAGLLGNTAVTGGAGSYYVGQGSLIVSNTTGSVTVTAGQGSRFVKGQWIGIQDSASTIAWRRVTNVATDTLTVWPNIGAGLTVGWVVVNGYTFAPAQYHTASLTIQHAKTVGSSVTAAQWTALGCTGDLALSWERGQLPKFSVDLKSSSHTGPSAQSIAVTAGSEDAASTAGVFNATTLLQAFATTTSANVKMLAASLKLNGGMMHLPDHGSANGVNGALRIPQRPFATAVVKLPFDPALDTTDWTNQTLFSLVQIVPIGTGLTQRIVGWELPNCAIVGKPKTSEDAGRLVTEITLEALEDVNVTTPTSDLDLAPVRIFAL